MSVTRPKKFILSHPDAFYSNGILEAFLTDLSGLISAGQIPCEDLEVQFVNGEPDRSLLKKLGIQDLAVYAHVVSSYQAKSSYLAKSTAILFIQRGACNGFIPQRFFELLTLKTNILALVPNPVAYAEYTIQNSNLWVINNRSPHLAGTAFLEMYELWKRLPHEDLGQNHSGQIVRENWEAGREDENVIVSSNTAA